MFKRMLRVSLWVWGLCVLYPLFWTVATSLKSTGQFNLGHAWDLPRLPLQFVNFTHAWQKAHFGTYFLNSLVVVLSAVVLSLLLSATTAFIIARHPFRGSGLMFGLYISTMMIPTILGLVPLFFFLSSLHLTNSLIGLSLLYTIMQVPFGVFVLVGFFKAMPGELEAAAAIDGCGMFGTFFKIMLPLARSGLVTVAIMNALAYWNEYLFALVLVGAPEKYTVSIGLAFLQGEMQYSVEWGVLFAALLISVVPVFLLYLFFQRQITAGLTAGALKG